MDDVAEPLVSEALVVTEAISALAADAHEGAPLEELYKTAPVLPTANHAGTGTVVPVVVVRIEPWVPMESHEGEDGVPEVMRTEPVKPTASGVYEVRLLATGMAPIVGAVEVFKPPLATGNVPVTPVERGSPVALVKTPADGVPMFGVTRVGEVARTKEPEPVAEVVPEPPAKIGSVPDVSTPLVLVE
jgi:hypothetical protein